MVFGAQQMESHWEKGPRDNDTGKWLLCQGPGTEKRESYMHDAFSVIVL